MRHIQLSSVFCNLHNRGSCFNRTHNKCTFWLWGFRWLHRQGKSTAVSVSRPGKVRLHWRCFPRGAGSRQPCTRQRKQTTGQAEVPVPAPCGCLVSRAGASRFGEQSMSACPRQSGAMAERAMLWQLSGGVRSISLGWASCLSLLVPAAHSVSQLRQRRVVRRCQLSVQCSPPELTSVPLKLHCTLQHCGTGNHPCCLRRKVSLEKFFTRKLTLSNQILHSAFKNRGGS